MSRSRKKVKPIACRWCGHKKRHRYPERHECENCTGTYVGEEKRRKARRKPCE